MLCRYQLINMCLNSRVKRYWSQQDLLDKLSEYDLCISKRTLEADIEAMRFDDRLGYHAPISYCTTNKGYYYSDESYSISKLNLTEEDIEALLVASDLVRPFESLGCIRNFPSVVQKILSNTCVSMLKGVGESEVLIGMGLPPEFSENIGQLLQAIREKVVVKIVYRNPEGGEREREFFHPYHLHEFENRWYVAGVLEADMRDAFLLLNMIDEVWFSDRNFIPKKESSLEVSVTRHEVPKTQRTTKEKQL